MLRRCGPLQKRTSKLAAIEDSVGLARASNAVSSTETPSPVAPEHTVDPLKHVSIDAFCDCGVAEMPIKPPVVREMDLIRARQIVSSLAPLKRLSSDDAEIIARTIAQSFAEGRKQGLYLAKDLEA